MELCGQRQGLGDRSERDVAEVQDDIGGSDGLVPAADQLGVHLRRHRGCAPIHSLIKKSSR